LCLLLSLALSGLHQCAGKVENEKAAAVSEELKKAMQMKRLAEKRPLRLRTERKQAEAEAKEKYKQLKQMGVDSVSNTKESQAVRAYEMRKKKKKWFLKKKEKSLSHVLFPGVHPVEYSSGDAIPMFAELVESPKTQLPYQYYSKLLPFCEKPEKSLSKAAMKLRSLGAKLQGVKPELAPYAITANTNVPCTVICAATVKKKERHLRRMHALIDKKYRVHLTFDGLPALVKNTELNYAVRGYPIGFTTPVPNSKGTPDYFIYNHLHFTISYHEDPDEFEGIRIVGFDVHPVSIQHEHESRTDDRGELVVTTCGRGVSPENDPHTFMPLPKDEKDIDSILYSYQVTWENSDVAWSDRWDVYLLGSPDDEFLILSMMNSIMMTLFLSAIVVIIMIRTLRKDIALYNEIDLGEDDGQEEAGWKLVHGDVFRPPSTSPLLLSVAVGTGAQIGTAGALTMLLALLKIINPMDKGAMLTAIIFLYVLSGSVAGFVSSRIYKFCDAKAWKRNTVVTAIAFPSFLTSVFLILNIILAFAGAATSVSLLTIICIFLLWICVSMPLAFVGSYLGFRENKIEVPTKTNQIARFVPEQNSAGRDIMAYLVCGALPFLTVIVEFAYIMGAIWLHHYFYTMGILFISMASVTITCIMVNVVMCYIQLCAEDHRWWWKSFLNGSAAGFYVFIYACWFFSTRLNLVGVLPVIVYFTYMIMISTGFALFCGSVSFLSCFWFTKRIYNAIKVD